MGVRPKTTELSHFNDTNLIRSVDLIIDQSLKRSLSDLKKFLIFTDSKNCC